MDRTIYRFPVQMCMGFHRLFRRVDPPATGIQFFLLTKTLKNYISEVNGFPGSQDCDFEISGPFNGILKR